LRNQIITLYKPIVAFGRELGRVDAFYGFIETAEPLQDAASAPPGRVGTFKPYFTASEIQDPEDVAAAIICEGTERDAPYGDKPEYLHQATEICTSYKSIFDSKQEYTTAFIVSSDCVLRICSFPGNLASCQHVRVPFRRLDCKFTSAPMF
jgi:hypothetical protein